MYASHPCDDSENHGGGEEERLWWTVCLRARTIVTPCLRRCVSCQHCKSIVRRKRGLGTDHVDRLDPLHGVQGPSSALFNRAARMQAMQPVSRHLFRVFFFLSLSFLFLFPNDGRSIACVKKTRGLRPRTVGRTSSFEREFFLDTRF